MVSRMSSSLKGLPEKEGNWQLRKACVGKVYRLLHNFLDAIQFFFLTMSAFQADLYSVCVLLVTHHPRRDCLMPLSVDVFLL